MWPLLSPPLSSFRFPISPASSVPTQSDAKAYAHFVHERSRDATKMLSRASFGSELLLVMMLHAIRLFITGFQNSSTVVAILVTNFEMVARPPL
ncbi:hypothetical protein EVAR_25341_1 [Eumeta japonica]|uniref:Uncharacterized protein n=1 Tax=Eumeta variegata TaxID=151549 RepID=A0A4C1Y0L1_EUMVA|nr:hypothetical protein EVAR_25341_1 [Eumeta japonica]